MKSMGFALAAAIVFDAFIVRMMLIPATLYLLGEKAWWMPAWLDRITGRRRRGEKPSGRLQGRPLSEADLIESAEDDDLTRV